MCLGLQLRPSNPEELDSTRLRDNISTRSARHNQKRSGLGLGYHLQGGERLGADEVYSATTAGAFGVVAGVFAIQFFSEVPKVRQDIVGVSISISLQLYGPTLQGVETGDNVEVNVISRKTFIVDTSSYNKLVGADVRRANRKFQLLAITSTRKYHLRTM